MKRLILFVFVLLFGFTSIASGQVIVAGDQSSDAWQQRATFHCLDEADDAIVLRAAGEAAVKGQEHLVLAPGFYRLQSCFEIVGDIKGIMAAGEVYLLAKGKYDGWLMKVQKLPRMAKIEGLGFNGQGKAKGLLVDDCHDITLERLHFSGVTSALHVKRGWFVHVRTIRVSDCRGGTEALVKLTGFTGSSVRGLVVYLSSAKAPMLSIRGTATCEDIDIEECESVGSPIVRIGGRHVLLSRLHFEENTAPIQVEAVDARQCDLRGFSFSGPKTNPVLVGVQLTRCRDTVVDGVIATHCTDAVVRLDSESVRQGCSAERIDLHYDRDKYDQWAIAPKHMIDYAGRGEDN